MQHCWMDIIKAQSSGVSGRVEAIWSSQLTQTCTFVHLTGSVAGMCHLSAPTGGAKQ